MDQEWSVRHYAVMMDVADTFIIWRLIRNTKNAGSENGWRVNAWTVCDAPVSSARPSWSRTIIGPGASFGSDAVGKKLMAQSRWESIYERELTKDC
jgi:hypothetical protein